MENVKKEIRKELDYLPLSLPEKIEDELKKDVFKLKVKDFSNISSDSELKDLIIEYKNTYEDILYSTVEASEEYKKFLRSIDKLDINQETKDQASSAYHFVELLLELEVSADDICRKLEDESLLILGLKSDRESCTEEEKEMFLLRIKEIYNEEILDNLIMKIIEVDSVVFALV